MNVKLSSATRALLATALVSSGAVLLPAATAQAETLTATLVKTTWTGGTNSNWAHPSPDPSGVTYNSRTDRLMIVDGEVEETGTAYPKHVWKGTNLFIASRQGALQETGLNTIKYTAEPVGVGFRPASSAFPEAMFISDDNQDRVFEVSAGGDGKYGTADDTQTSFSTRFTGSYRDDAEDVAVDLELTRTGELLIIDGYFKEVYVYGPGPNKKFDGLDDTRRQFDVQAHGAGDPEGIAYNPARQTIFVLDDPSNQIIEFGLDGKPLNHIKLPMTMKSGAGIALAPPSNGSGGAPNAYIVDRGVDNDTNQDTFNDGRLYEVAIPNNLTGGGTTTPAPENAPPTVNAGQDASVVLPNSANLDGTVTDPEGKPVTSAWTKVSGDGTVTFGNAAAQDTTATFSAAGTYVLRLTGSDGSTSKSDDVTITVTSESTPPPPSGAGVLDVAVKAGSDDAEERTKSGKVALGSGDLNLGQEDSYPTAVGMRFQNVTVPAGATIKTAYVTFTADEIKTATSKLTIAGQASDNPAAFTTAAYSISQRPKTSAQVVWEPAGWPATGVKHQSADITSVVQEIVKRGDWAIGDPLVLLVTGAGERAAESYEGGAAKAPVLHIEFG